MWCPRGVMVNAPGCKIVEEEFELQSCYYIGLSNSCSKLKKG